MGKPPLPKNEPQRLKALQRYRILDTPPEQAIDDLTRVASQICGTPVAMVSLIDEDRQWFKSRVGVEIQETPRDVSFCAHAILGDNLMVVPDAQKDERFVDSPFVQAPSNVRFYAGAPLLDPDGHALGTICVLDVKPRSLTPEQAEALRALSRQVVAQFELRKSVFDLGRLLDQKDEFLRIASHDLKNPLTVVGASAMILESVVPPGATMSDEAHSVLVRIARQADTMRRIIEDYLDSAAIEDGEIKLKLEPGDLNAVARDATENNSDYAASKQITMTFEPAAELRAVTMDQSRIEQVAQNFVSNAIKFSPKGGTVLARTLESDGRVLMEVCDCGPGLSDDDMGKLFTKYARLSNKPTGGEKSSGLGLAICKQLIDLHGGEIGARNNPAAGSTFWFALK